MYILGISAFYHDSAAALVKDGRIVAAAQEERFTRKKHDAGFPQNAIDYCLAEAGIDAAALDYVGFYDKPLAKFERLLETYMAFAPAGFASFAKAMPEWLHKKINLPRVLRRGLGKKYKGRFVFTNHHESHAASAFFPSPFEQAAILTIDGVGEWATATIGQGTGHRIKMLRELHFPHSLGLLYSAFTYYCGFAVNSGEYKLMGLAPYGRPIFKDKIFGHLVDLRDDGSIHMDMSYFNYCQGLTMTAPKFDRLFGAPRRQTDEPTTQFYMDVAASIQSVTEEVVLRMARHAHEITGQSKLVMAGGVALNCVANGRLLREGPFDDIWIQPAAGDAGGALGTAMFIWHQLLDKPRQCDGHDAQQSSLLGPEYSDDDIRAFLDRTGAKYDTIDDEPELVDRVATMIDEGKVVGWFQGRMEFGPRALGSRSILGDARSTAMQSLMNQKIKFRESFRPFAPCVLRSEAHHYFDVRENQDSPYMLLVAGVSADKRIATADGDRHATGLDLLQVERSEIPAVTHVDHSARIQTVDLRNGRYYRLLKRFHERTGCPVIVNTSFNMSWEPIVNRPEEAYRAFMSSEIDALVMGNLLIVKDQQPPVVQAVREDAGNERCDAALETLWSCPACGGGLRRSASTATCRSCHRQFERTDGIWELYWPHDITDGDVTEVVKKFYETHPFPNYEEHDSVRSLITYSERSIYAKLLAQQIPYNANVLEVGCGTGQLSNFLGIACRTVVGADLCLNSLRLAETFRREQNLSRVRFVQMNLFRPSFAPQKFDVVLCNGVLHHTSDPRGGFKRILRLVRPGGHIIIGLYNRYGRLMHDARRTVFRATGGRLKWLDPQLRTLEQGHAKQSAWFADQYQHPHESKHTFDEVLSWFEQEGIEFVNAIPKLGAAHDLGAASGLGVDEQLFEQGSPGTRLGRVATQAAMVVTASREGGFFIMIGRKREQA